MAFRVPTFNIDCNVWFDGETVPPGGAPDVSVECQLRWCGHGPSESQDPDFTSWQPGWLLLVPKGTDIRDRFNASGKALVECPVGTGRYYQVNYVDDVARGFTNEYRMAFLNKVGEWPSPIP